MTRSESKGRWAWFAAGLPMLFYLAFPLAALLIKGSVPNALAELSTESAREAIFLSLKTTVLSALFIALFGTPLAYWIARGKSRMRQLVETFVEVPVALPPAAAGVALLVAFGREGFWNLGASFTAAAVVMAQVFVSAPLFLRPSIGALEQIPEELFESARSDGAGPWQSFSWVALPAAKRALFGGLVMAWARAAGEFGATIIFAGNYPGRTQTMPLAIYLGFEVDLKEALALAVLLLLVAAMGIIFAQWVMRGSGEVEPKR